MSSDRPVRVEVAHRFAVGLRDGYDYITDLGNWHAYWPGLVRIDPDSRWSASGDRTRIALRLLGRETEMTMILDRMEPYRLVEYVPRGGLRGVFARVIFRRAVERAVRSTVANLDARFAARDASP